MIFWNIAPKGGQEKAISDYLKEMSAVFLVLSGHHENPAKSIVH